MNIQIYVYIICLIWIEQQMNIQLISSLWSSFLWWSPRHDNHFFVDHTKDDLQSFSYLRKRDSPISPLHVWTTFLWHIIVLMVFHCRFSVKNGACFSHHWTNFLLLYKQSTEIQLHYSNLCTMYSPIDEFMLFCSTNTSSSCFSRFNHDQLVNLHNCYELHWKKANIENVSTHVH